MTKKFDVISVKDYAVVVDVEAPCPASSWAVFPDTTNGEITTYNPPIKCQWDYAANGVYNLLVIGTLIKRIEGIPLIELPNQDETDANIYVINQYIDYGDLNEQAIAQMRQAWLDGAGYKAAQRGTFSEEDIKKAFEAGQNYQGWDSEMYMESIQKKKLPVQVELEVKNQFYHGIKDKWYDGLAMVNKTRQVPVITNPKTNTITPVNVIYE